MVAFLNGVGLFITSPRLISSKKTKKLTKTEEEMFASLTKALQGAQARVEKEVDDVEQLV